MGGMGGKEKYWMYQFVCESECKEYRNACTHILTRNRSLLMERNIVTQFTLVDSGARNMVTRNGDGPSETWISLL